MELSSESVFALKKLSYSLRFFRRQKDYTQQEMAAALDVSVRNYQRIELGQIVPRLCTLFKISRLLDTEVSRLIRPTSEEKLFRAFSTKKEYAEFKEQHLTPTATAGTIELCKKLIQQDALENTGPSPELFARLDGTIATLSPELQKFSGIETEKCDYTPYVIHGSALERWELAFRLRMREGVMENVLLVPTGLKFIREYHVNLDPNPEAPVSEVYIEDVTDRRNLEEWAKTIALQSRSG